MKIAWKNIPFAAAITAGAILLHYLLYSYGIILSLDPVSRTYTLVFFIAAALLPYSHVLRAERHELIQFYVDSFTFSVFVLALILMFSELTLPIVSALVFLCAVLMWRTYGKDLTYITRSAVYTASLIILLSIAGIVRYNAYNPAFPLSVAGSAVPMKHILVFSIYNNENPAGVPFYLQGGVIIQGISSVLTLSFQSIAIYGIISAFLTENYYLIVSYVLETRKGFVRGTASAVSTALSCQCETISAALPSFSVLFLSIASFLLLSEGFAVLLFTFLVISRVFKKGKDTVFLKLKILKDRLMILTVSFALIAAIPLIEIFGIMLNMISNLLFLLGTGILMFSEGAAVIYLISEIIGGMKMNRSFYVPLITVSTAAMFIWYIPSLLQLAGTLPPAFLAMNASSVISGAIAGALYLSMDGVERRLLVEYTLMMFNMVAIIVFYFSVVKSYVIWPYFGLAQQTVFSILLVAVSLPLTVLNTNLTLNSYATPAV